MSSTVFVERTSKRVRGREKRVGAIDMTGPGKLLIKALKGKEKEDSQLTDYL